ncbi:MAG TPA: GNAT family N-acetyltransferase [Pedobacter sp.]
MQYLTVTAIDAPFLPFIKKLYNETFPAEERRDWKQLLDMVGTVEEMQLQVITDKEEAIGFIIFWIFDDWCFIEHFAVSPDHRGMKYGEKIMKSMMGERKILLEVEPPSSAGAVRRIRFYERLGFVLLPFVYRQPSYREAGISYEMELMTNHPGNDRGQFDGIISKTLQRVYGIGASSPE